jgi:NAD(P)-dependent dehydrogenase (short-subunit alcohol dehydrogenase family)
MNDQKVVVITGSSSGIGFESALVLARNGSVSDAVIAMREKGVSSVLVTSDHHKFSHAQYSEIEHARSEAAELTQ